MKIWTTFTLILGFSFSFSFSLLANDKITITGSSTIAPMLLDVAKSFEKENPKIRVDIQTGGSSRGIYDTKKSLAHIGMVSRSLKKSEQDLYQVTIAKDGISIILHASNPVKNLDFEQVQKIYRGEIKNWKEVGGNKEPIVVVNKAEGRSTLELFLKHFKLKNSQIKASVIIGDNEQGIKTVSKSRQGIGYVSIGAAEYNQIVGTPIKLLPMSGISASVKNVENGRYPLARELNLVLKQAPVGAIKKFIDYLFTQKGNRIVREHYFVPINKK